MDQKKQRIQLARLLEYVLGRRPDEFGLVPDPEGYVKAKELIQAINEDASSRRISLSGIQELTVSFDDCPIEFSETLIRSVRREHLVSPEIPQETPGVLYICVRQKSWPHITEKGLFPAGTTKIVLSPDLKMAERMGKRKDPSPVTLQIQVAKAEAQGVLFEKLGECLFLCKYIPVDCITGPPPEKHKPPAKKKAPPPHQKKEPLSDAFQDGHPYASPGNPTVGKRDRLSWKNNKKRIRRDKQRDWPT